MTEAPSATDEVFATALPPALQEVSREPHTERHCRPFVIWATTLSADSLLTSFTTTFAPLDAKNSE